MEILLANPRGFCAGVDRAIQIVERALESFGAPVYVRHEVVHNKYVVDDLKDKGAVFVEEVDEIPDNATAIFSAHGVSQQVRNEAAARGLEVFDATCPLVTKVHMEVARHGRHGRDCVLIGHAGHPEVEGTMGQWRPHYTGRMHLVQSPAEVAELEVDDPEQLAFVTQTTLSVDDTAAIIEALRQRFPAIIGPGRDDICYATQNRQDAAKSLARQCDTMLVVGSPTSSNSNRLRELAEKMGVSAYLLDDPAQIEPHWLADCQRVGITAGASAPEVLVEQLINHLKTHYNGKEVQENAGKTEDIVFSLPKELIEIKTA